MSCTYFFSYCTNIVFYLLLKCRRADTKSHPVSNWITQYKNTLNETEPAYTNVFQPLVKQILRGKLNPSELINKKE